jgi:hypothetical protein
MPSLAKSIGAAQQPGLRSFDGRLKRRALAGAFSSRRRGGAAGTAGVVARGCLVAVARVYIYVYMFSERCLCEMFDVCANCEVCRSSSLPCSCGVLCAVRSNFALAYAQRSTQA